MARRQIEIVVKVENLASRQLADVEKSVRKTGKAVQDTGRDIVQFNKTLFSATAFFGTFKRAAVGAFTGIEQGANFDRLANQFEALFGERSILEFRKNLKGMSDTAIDTVEAMRAAVSLNQLGIKKDLGTIATFLSKAGVAAKMAGLNSAVGVREMTEFMKDGSVSHLQHLNLISNTNAELQAGLSVTMHSNKLLGAMLTTQEKLAIAQSLLNRRTKDNMKGNRDLADSFEEVRSSLNVLKLSTFTFIGKSIRPLMDGFSKIASKLSDFSLGLRLTMPEGSTFVKMLIKATTASAALVASLGALKLTTIALTSLGFGIPKLLYVFGGLLGFLWGATSGTGSFIDRLKNLGKALESIAQLVESVFDPKHLGIGEVDSIIYDRLPQGLKSVIAFLSRTFAVLRTFVKDTVDFLKEGAKFLDEKFGGVISKITNFLQSIDKPWDIKLIDPNVTKEDKIKRWLKVSTALAGAFVGLKMAGGLLSRVPLIGKLFGGGGGGADGSRSRPFYVIMSAAGAAGSAAAASLLGMPRGAGSIAGKVQSMILGNKMLGEIFTNPAGKMAGLRAVGGGLLKGAAGLAAAHPIVAAVLALLGPAILGAFQGIAKGIPTLFEGIGKAFSGLSSLVSAIWDVYVSPALDYVGNAISGWWEGSILKTAIENTMGAVKVAFGWLIDSVMWVVKKWAGSFGISSDFFEGLTKAAGGGLSGLGEFAETKAAQIRGTAKIPENKTESTDAVKAQLDAKKEQDNKQMIENLTAAQQRSTKADPSSLERRSHDLMIQQNSLLSDILKETKNPDISQSTRRE